MFEALIYDERDRASNNPASTLGTFEDRADAWLAITAYLAGGLVADVPRCIDRVEVVAVAD